eukprot:jgi/Ulvmu1/8453/UM043_0033.1
MLRLVATRACQHPLRRTSSNTVRPGMAFAASQRSIALCSASYISYMSQYVHMSHAWQASDRARSAQHELRNNDHLVQDQYNRRSALNQSSTWEQASPRKAVTLLVGGPGSGKGTLGIHIARQLGCDSCVTMSDALRQRQPQATPSNTEAPCTNNESLTSSAALVGDAQACSAFQHILASLDSAASSSVMIDGFPRSREQTEFVARLAAAALGGPQADAHLRHAPHSWPAAAPEAHPKQPWLGSSSADSGFRGPPPASHAASPFCTSHPERARGTAQFRPAPMHAAVDVTLVILEVSEATSVARQLGRARAALAHNEEVAATGQGQYLPVRATDCCEDLCRERHAVYECSLPHLERLAAVVPTIRIDAEGPLGQARRRAQHAVAAFRATQQQQALRAAFVTPERFGGPAARRGGTGRSGRRGAAWVPGAEHLMHTRAYAARGRHMLAPHSRHA